MKLTINKESCIDSLRSLNVIRTDMYVAIDTNAGVIKFINNDNAGLYLFGNIPFTSQEKDLSDCFDAEFEVGNEFVASILKLSDSNEETLEFEINMDGEKYLPLVVSNGKFKLSFELKSTNGREVPLSNEAPLLTLSAKTVKLNEALAKVNSSTSDKKDFTNGYLIDIEQGITLYSTDGFIMSRALLDAQVDFGENDSSSQSIFIDSKLFNVTKTFSYEQTSIFLFEKSIIVMNEGAGTGAYLSRNTVAFPIAPIRDFFNKVSSDEIAYSFDFKKSDWQFILSMIDIADPDHTKGTRMKLNASDGQPSELFLSSRNNKVKYPFDVSNLKGSIAEIGFTLDLLKRVLSLMDSGVHFEAVNANSPVYLYSDKKASCYALLPCKC